MSIILLILAVFKSIFTACSDKTTGPTCSADTTCDWQEGICAALTAAECNAEACAAGCSLTDEILGTCTDPNTALGCGSKATIPACTSTTGCSWDPSGTCSNPTTPIDCTFDEGSWSCPSGCVDTTHEVCSKSSGSSIDCSLISTAETTECAYVESESSGACGVSGSSCVGSEPPYETLCPTFSTTTKISECTLASSLICIVSGSSCIPNVVYIGLFGQDPTSYTSECAGYTVAPVSECGANSNCRKSGSVCVNKSPEEICNSNSITLDISECDWFGECCVTSGSSCVAKGGAPSICSFYPACSTLNAAKTMSECTEAGGECIVNGDLCSYDAFPCVLNTSVPYTQCSDDSFSHGCQVHPVYDCNNKDCLDYTSNPTCTSNSDELCSWSNDGHCSVATPRTCTAMGGGSCDSASIDSGCSSTAYQPSVCSVPSVPPATCTALSSSDGCLGVSGCKWLSTGGRCLAKECDSSLTETECKSGNACQWDASNGCSKKSPPKGGNEFPWWIIVIIVVVVVVMIVAIVITLVVMKVKKAACFGGAKVKVEVADDSDANNNGQAPTEAEAEAEAASTGAGAGAGGAEADYVKKDNYQGEAAPPSAVAEGEAFASPPVGESDAAPSAVVAEGDATD